MATKKSAVKPKANNRAKPYWEMNTDELAAATAKFDREFVADEFGKATPKAKRRLSRSDAKRGRPKKGRGAKVISVSLEQGLLEKADKLAKQLSVSRAQLISRGLQALMLEKWGARPVS
jgi:hypothetical protein